MHFLLYNTVVLIRHDPDWWWNGVTIRLAQQIGLHRELPASRLARFDQEQSVRRRIWWTLFVSDIGIIVNSIIHPTYMCLIRSRSAKGWPLFAKGGPA